MNLKRLVQFLNFIDRASLTLLALAVLAGVVLFGVEFGFAYSLQAFLAQIGGLSAASLKVPRYFLHLDLSVILIAIALLGSLRAFLQWAQYYMEGIASKNLELFLKTKVLRFVFFSPHPGIAETLTLFNERCDTAADGLGSLQGITMQFTAAIFLLGSMVYLAPQVTLVGVLILILVAFPLKRFNAEITKAGIGVYAEDEQIYFRLANGIKNLLLLQIYGTRGLEYQQATTALNRHFKHLFSFYRLSGLKFVIPQLLGIFLICSLMWIIQVHHFQSSAGLVTYFYLCFRFIQVFSDLLRTSSHLFLQWPQLNLLIEWWQSNGRSIEETFERSTLEIRESPPPFQEQLGWSLNNVGFRYPNETSDVIQSLSLNIRPRETLVITGTSGVGKSTLLQLLLGLFQPTSGEIQLYCGETPLTMERSRQTLLSSIGFVGPDPFLIEGTVLENLAYGLTSPPSADEDLRSVIELAQCDFIFELTDGLNHRLTEQGAGLSAGQKQRLALARALLRKPVALFLDEATANLDRHTEAHLVESLRALKSKMTIVAVTHRDALGKIADQILSLPSALRRAA